ncbi:MAG: hypothetical protein CMJ68_07960 [Planctomycetaceae bacterium]|nr:hypothetical protein [Planctomycetaceae bacterium]
MDGLLFRFVGFYLGWSFNGFGNGRPVGVARDKCGPLGLGCWNRRGGFRFGCSVFGFGGLRFGIWLDRRGHGREGSRFRRLGLGWVYGPRWIGHDRRYGRVGYHRIGCLGNHWWNGRDDGSNGWRGSYWRFRGRSRGGLDGKGDFKPLVFAAPTGAFYLFAVFKNAFNFNRAILMPLHAGGHLAFYVDDFPLGSIVACQGEFSAERGVVLA